jgi:hypothetical protein
VGDDERQLITFVAGEDNVGILQQMSAEEVEEGVVFFVDGEDGGVGCAYSLVRGVEKTIAVLLLYRLTGVRRLSDLLLAVAEEEELKAFDAISMVRGRSVSRCKHGEIVVVLMICDG